MPAMNAESAAAPLAAVPRNSIRWIAIILAVAGWWISGRLLATSFAGQISGPLLQALCRGDASDDQTSDCQSVLASEWASIPISATPGAPRMPIAAYGMGYFAFVGLWYLLIGCPTHDRRPWHFVLLAVVVVGLLASLHYTYVMYAVLERWCLGCTVVHGVNAALGLLTLLAFPLRREKIRYEPHPRGRLVIATFTGGCFLFLLHVVITFVFVQNRYVSYVAGAYESLTTDPDYIQWHYARQPVVEIPEDIERGWIGEQDAANTLVVFLDFECSACKKAHEVITNAMNRHPGALRVSLRHYPLDPACNQHVPAAKHPSACAAAAIAEAVRIDGDAEQFATFKKLLYERQYELKRANYAAWIDEIGLDGREVTATSRTQAVRDRITTDIELAHALGVTAAPALFLNSRKLDFWSKPETWDALLAEHQPPAASD